MSFQRFFTHEERLLAFRNSRVYPVVTGEFCSNANVPQTVRAVLEGGAKVVQIREKSMPDREYFELLCVCRELTAQYGALLIADDRVDAALCAGADGVHLGQEDLPVKEVRKFAPDLLLGVSTHNREEILLAQGDGCSYLNIGPVYPTKTKTLPMPALGETLLQELKEFVTVPFSVMGGITFMHLERLRSFSVEHVAAVTAFTRAEDPAEEIRKWEALLRK